MNSRATGLSPVDSSESAAPGITFQPERGSGVAHHEMTAGAASSTPSLQMRARRALAAGRFFARFAPTIAVAAAKYFVAGPPHASWDLRMTLLMAFLARYMDDQTAQMGGDLLGGSGTALARLERAQRAMSRPAPLPDSVEQRYIQISRNEEVVGKLRELLGAACEMGSHSGAVTCDYFVHKDVTDTRRAVLFLHGGAYIFGSADGSHRWLTPRLSKMAGVKVLGVNYRLSPQAAFPAALVDALSAYLHLIDDMGFDPKDITILGDSAGGNLSMATRIALGELYPAKIPGNLVLLSPWCDLTHSLPVDTKGDYLPNMGGGKGAGSVPAMYCPDGKQLRHRLVSPLFAPDTALTFPGTRILLQVGSVERLYGEDLWMGSKLAAANTAGTVRIEVYEDMPHVHQAFLFLPAARAAIQRISNFLKGDGSSIEVFDVSAKGIPTLMSETEFRHRLDKIGKPKMGGVDPDEAAKEIELVEEVVRSRL